MARRKKIKEEMTIRAKRVVTSEGKAQSSDLEGQEWAVGAGHVPFLDSWPKWCYTVFIYVYFLYICFIS